MKKCTSCRKNVNSAPKTDRMKYCYDCHKFARFKKFFKKFPIEKSRNLQIEAERVKNIIKDLYDEGFSATDISEKFNVNNKSILNFMKKLDIKIRSISEATDIERKKMEEVRKKIDARWNITRKNLKWIYHDKCFIDVVRELEEKGCLDRIV